MMLNFERKLLFINEDVLPHELGFGSSSFIHPHNRRSEKKAEDSTSPITLSASNSSPIVKEEDSTELIHMETDLKLVHNVNELSITDTTGVTTGAEQLKVVTAESSDNSRTVSNGVTFNITATSSTALQSTKSPIATSGNHSNCTSVFIDVVEWLSPLVIGQLDGKVKK